jgi:hypothetical protein
MPKPCTFVSSTFYDLKDARASIRSYLESIGHEALLSETKEFGIAPGVNAHDACIDQVNHSDYFILIIGGRRGSTVSSGRSITNEEYLLSNLLKAAGEAELAKRVRPSSRKPGQTIEDAQDETPQ